MRNFVLAGVAVLASAASADAAPVVVTYTGSLASFTAPASGQYAITAIGARGGNSPNSGGTGGLGAEAGGTFSLVQGEVLTLLVGAAGADGVVQSQAFSGFGGGGGGSFVVGSDGSALVVAGGGGGGGQRNAAYPPDFQPVHGGPAYNGGDALTGRDGGASPNPGQGGVFGGGAGGAAGSDGGGGFSGPAGPLSNAGHGFNAFPDLGHGAYGGGGLSNISAGAGGGGGYSGGGGGGLAGFFGTFKYGIGGSGGGGGGSFTSGMDPVLLARIGTGDGEILVNQLGISVPEPAGLGLFCAALLGLLARRWRSAGLGGTPSRQ